VEINEWDFHAAEFKGRRSDVGLEATEQASRVARVNAGGGDIFGNNRAGTYNYLVTDCNRENGGIRSDTYTVTKLCWPPKLRLASRSTREEQVINKHRTMRDEAVVTDRDQVADERMRLNAASLADGCSLLYLDKRPDEGIIADVTTV
jgi:hypothetical protein